MNTTLLLSLLFCHFLADYTHLSTNKMLAAKKFGTPLLPILEHASVHGTLMFLTMMLLLPWSPNIFTLASIQIVSHFIIDTLKGKMNYWFPVFQSPANKAHWYLFGFDQFLHVYVIIRMVQLS